jgi:DUF3054 family protein
MARATTDRADRRGVVALAALDGLALVAFTVVGVANHDHGLPADALARVGLPLLVAWFLTAWAVGTYRRPGLRTMVLAWAIAVPVGALVRTAIAGGPWGGEFLVFLGVALAFTLLFLLLGRGLARAFGLGEPAIEAR